MAEARGTADPTRAAARRTGTLAGSFALVASLVTAAGVAAVLRHDAVGFVPALLFAAGLCLPASLAGWILARRPARRPESAVAGPLAAIVVRLLPPLAGLGWLSTPAGRGLREGGAGEMLVGFYLVQLVTDILLHIMMGRTHTNRPD